MRSCSAEIGSGSTPRNGAGSIATDAADRPRPARIWVSSPPKRVADHGRLASSLPITAGEVVGDLADGLVARRPPGAPWPRRRCRGRRASPGVTARSRPPRRASAQRSQLLGSSHRPWTNTTGVLPEALARSTCSETASGSVVVMTRPYGSRAAADNAHRAPGARRCRPTWRRQPCSTSRSSPPRRRSARSSCARAAAGVAGRGLARGRGGGGRRRRGRRRLDRADRLRRRLAWSRRPPASSSSGGFPAGRPAAPSVLAARAAADCASASWLHRRRTSAVEATRAWSAATIPTRAGSGSASPWSRWRRCRRWRAPSSRSAALGSSAAASESRQTMLCAYLSAALLVGLGANAAAGWWWADPRRRARIAAVALREAATPGAATPAARRRRRISRLL